MELVPRNPAVTNLWKFYFYITLVYVDICFLMFMACFKRQLFLVRLQVVSTRVGGVPEVLPSDMIRLAEPSVKCKHNNVFNTQ